MLPVRLPLMETTENTATPSPAPTADTRRRSGRERRVPEKFQPEVTIAPKRKRGSDEDDVENQNPDEDDDVDEDEDEDMPSEDEASPDEDEERAARPKRKKPTTTSSRPSRAKKPAAKKPKINGTAPANAPSITVGLPSRPKPKKTARVITGDARDGDGVYGEYSLNNTREDEMLTRSSRYLWVG